MNGIFNPGDVVLGKWKLEKLIGAGSFGKVYEATRNDFGSYKAAIKIITIPQNPSEIADARAEGMDDASVAKYFRSVVEEIVGEFGLMSKFKGTGNIVSYEDHDVIPHSDGIGWDILIRMELLTPLMDHMRQKPLSTHDVMRLGDDICKALELCHKNNVIHRDIKPENIFVTESGDFKLGDFGIARTIEKTGGGLSKKGTYTYMAPEVYREQSYGPSVDLYSLGIVLYRLLNDNRAPFLPPYPERITHSDRENAMARRLSGEPLPPPKNADPRLVQMIQRACAFDPNQRYWSPSQMRSEIETLRQSDIPDMPLTPGAAAQDSTVGSFRANANIPGQTAEERTTGIFTQGEEDRTTGIFGGSRKQGPSGPQTTVTTAGPQTTVTTTGPQTTVTTSVPETNVTASGPQTTTETKGKGSANGGGKKGGKGLIIGLIAAVAVLAVVLCILLFGGKGNPSPSIGGNISNKGNSGESSGDESFEDLPDSGDLRDFMIWGTYNAQGTYVPSADGGDYEEDLTQFVADIKYNDMDMGGGKVYELSVLPTTFTAFTLRNGGQTFGDVYINFDDPNDMLLLKDAILEQYGSEYWANYNKLLDLNAVRLELCDKNGKTYRFDAIYRLEGNKLILSILTFTDESTFAFTLTDLFECKVALDGNNLVLARNGKKVTYQNFRLDGSRGGMEDFYSTGYVYDVSQAYHDIISIHLSGDHGTDPEGAYTSIKFSDGYYAINPSHTFNEDGTLTIQWEGHYEEYNGKTEAVEEPVSITCEYLVTSTISTGTSFNGGMYSNDGLLLNIDGTWYRYQNSKEQYEGLRLQGVDTENLTEDQVDEIIITQDTMLEELDTALSDAGISATIDQTTGKVSMDANFLFDSGDATLSAEGKAYLDGFMDVYTAVVLNDSYSGYVSEIVVEGHTDTEGSYDFNQQLSEDRAASVANYCLGRHAELGAIMTTIGFSYDYPVYNEDGTVNMDASRRVTFRVVLTPIA